MKTIAITIDEDTLKNIDTLLETNRAPGKNRSQVIRRAAQEYVTTLQQAAEDEREREVFRRNRGRLKKQASALIKEQARP